MLPRDPRPAGAGARERGRRARALPAALPRAVRGARGAGHLLRDRPRLAARPGDRRARAALLRQALAAGHELANHSFAHAYDMVTWTPAAIYDDLRRCDACCAGRGAAAGLSCAGLHARRRALQQVAALGYRYDASLLPSPSYYAPSWRCSGGWR
ncbi:polysaccharide deacetylase family protein [Nannocystis sp.]|uniref:polysaccharide deacetylase family protein n=1 Tax=Nannocystis sp. TaxID=1962667 RepID=UPI003450C4F6